MPKILTRLSPLYSLLFTLLFLAPCLLFSDPDLKRMTIQVPMRDGLELQTDLIIPKNLEGPHPCILIRTPYKAHLSNESYANMAHLGYVIAIQSLRSSTYSEDYPEPYMQDAWGALQDGYDTIGYLANSEYTNGKIGMFGASAMGIVQLLTAPSNPPYLKCQFIQMATPSLYHHAAYIGGKFCKHQIESWFAKEAPLAYEHMLQHKEYDAYWEQVDALKKAENVEIPALHYGGWYDIFSQGTLDAFTSWQNEGGEGAKGKQRLIMGPWTHWGTKPKTFGEFPIPDNSLSFSESEVIHSWFDYHLKDNLQALDHHAPILYYAMGPLDGTESKGNQWKSAKNWPPEHQKQMHYFTKSYQLSEKRPLFRKHSYKLKHDPENPVPTIGGRNLYLTSGPYDQSPNESREDVLVFSTDLLEKDTEITGRILANLFVSSSAPSTDVAISLTDVYPDGKSVLIAEGIQNIKCPGNEVVAATVDLWSTSMVFAKGHRIRVNIACSNYPHFDKNAFEADNVIHVGTKHPSHLLLPAILD